MKNENYGAEEIYLAPETITADEEEKITAEAEPKATVRVSEILDLREGNRKVFRMSDGSEQAVYYPGTVHVYDEDTDTFDDVDNTLVEEEDGRHFVSGKNRLKARFSREEENDELFSVQSGMYRVTVCARKNSKQRNKGVKPKVKTTGGVDRALVFADVQPGADYE